MPDLSARPPHPSRGFTLRRRPALHHNRRMRRRRVRRRHGAGLRRQPDLHRRQLQRPARIRGPRRRLRGHHGHRNQHEHRWGSLRGAPRNPVQLSLPGQWRQGRGRRQFQWLPGLRKLPHTLQRVPPVPVGQRHPGAVLGRPDVYHRRRLHRPFPGHGHHAEPVHDHSVDQRPAGQRSHVQPHHAGGPVRRRERGTPLPDPDQCRWFRRHGGNGEPGRHLGRALFLQRGGPEFGIVTAVRPGEPS